MLTWLRGTLPGYPLAGYPQTGYPPRHGTPQQGTPWQGTPADTPILTWPGGVPYLGTPRQGTPQQGTPWQGTPRQGTPQQGAPPRLDLAGYPPRCLPHGILGNVAKHYGIWVPPPCGQTEGQTRVKTLPSLRTTYAGGNHLFSQC